MADKIFPKNITELLADIEREWTALMQVVNRLTPDQMTAPDSGGWSPKDNLAHLSAWMHFLMEYDLGHRPAHIVTGIDAETFNSLDEDRQNDLIFKHNRGRSTDDVLSELKNNYNETIKMLETMDFQNLMEPLQSDAVQQHLVMESVIGNTSEHFSEHRIIIERALNPRKP